MSQTDPLIQFFAESISSESGNVDHVIELEYYTSNDDDGIFIEWNDYFEESILVEKNLDNKVQPRIKQFWGDISDKGSLAQRKGEAEALYNSLVDKMKSRREKLYKGLKSSLKGTQHAEIMINVKPLDSFLNKVVDRNKPASKVTDFLRSSVICKTDEDVRKVVENLFKAFDKVTEYDEKKRGGDKQYGYYGSHHLLVVIDGVEVEVQVMTKKLHRIKHDAHKIYKTFRASSDVDPEILKKAMMQSKKLFDLGNGKRRG